MLTIVVNAYLVNEIIYFYIQWLKQLSKIIENLCNYLLNLFNFKTEMLGKFFNQTYYFYF